MSKAENTFAVIRERRDREILKAMVAACEFMTADCARCPLEDDDMCAEKQLAPAVLDDKHSACTDWVFLYFRAATTE
jgi:hypothetical protein